MRFINNHIIYLIFSIWIASFVVVESQPCDHPIYCSGQILVTVQMAQIFNDSKTFVDMPLRYPLEQVLQSFQKMVNNATNKGGPSPSDVGDFVSENFYPAGYEVVALSPPDWVPFPSFLSNIDSAELRAFGLSVHNKWQDLSRTFNHTGLCDQCYSSISVPYPFIIAGSRFREYYYWDSFWMIQGLLVSDMTTTARGMLLNFASIFNQIGFIPNGGRLYYLDRTQPPLFTQMVQEFFKVTEDTAFLAEVLPTLDKEYQYWMENRAVQIESPNYAAGHTLNMYNVSTNQPRPESYFEDFTSSEPMTEDERIFYYSSLATAAESGMDFSTKWFRPGSLNITSIETIRVVSVDLNSILYANEVSLSNFHAMFGNDSMSAYYAGQAAKRLAGMMDIMWSKEDLQWYDYDLNTGAQRSNYYITNYMPLWAGLHRAQPNYFTPELLELVAKSMFSVTMTFVGGVPTSLIESGQQWDFPYAWSPQQYFIIEALLSTNNSIGSDMAMDLIQRWVETNYCGWESTISVQDGMMFEKYNVEEVGLPGGGGEYVVQEGFGWTNGVALYLLNTYGDYLAYNGCPNSSSSSNSN